MKRAIVLTILAGVLGTVQQAHASTVPEPASLTLLVSRL